MHDPLDDLQAVVDDLQRRQRYRTAWRWALIVAHLLSGTACLVLLGGSAPADTLEASLWALVAVHTITLANLISERRRS